MRESATSCIRVLNVVGHSYTCSALPDLLISVCQLKEKGFIEELKSRRVIRTALVYGAVAWVTLQAADLLAGADLVNERAVRWLIILGVIGFPATLIASWFLDSPWRASKRLAVVGDIVIIVAVSAAAFLFAWQQWFASFTRPTIVVESFVATDTRSDSQKLAERISRNLRTMLAMQPELRVLEFGSTSESASYRIAGTLAQGASTVRVTVQLFESGSVLWSDSIGGSLNGEKEILGRIQSELWSRLPASQEAIKRTKSLLADCDSLAERDSLLAQASQKFDEVEALPPPRRPVAQQLAMQYLRDTDAICPGWPDTELLRLENTLQFENDAVEEDELLRRYPNSALVYRKIAARRLANGAEGDARALYIEACHLQPDPAMPYCN